MSRLGRNFRQRGPVQQRSTIQRALAVLRKFGTDAHIWLPGVGSINGLTAANYLLSDASTGLAPVDQYVGRANDALGGVGVEKAPDPGCDTPALWAMSGALYWSVAGGKLNLSSADGTAAYADTSVYTSLTTGATYQVEFDLVGASGSLTVYIRGGTGLPLTISTRRVSFQYVAGSSGSAPIRFGSFGAGSYTIDNISVREVTGIAATQPTTANKPNLVRGAVNLLTYSGDFTNAVWVKTRVSIAQGAGFAGRPSNLVTWDGTSTNGYCYMGQNVASGVAYTLAAIWKPVTVNSVQINVFAQNGNCNFSLIGVGSAVPWGTVFTGSILPLSDGFYLVACSYTATATGVTNISHGLLNGSADFAGAALFQGTYTAAQIQALGGIPLTLTAPASTTLGPYWWDTTGGKSLSVTFPAGYESATVIDAAKTGQVTQTAQNVVGAYNITTPTHGRFVIKAAITAPELTLLQKLANSLAGL